MPYISPNLHSFENKVYSQFGEDGVISQIMNCLEIKKGTYFEFGIGPSFGGTTRDLEGNFVLLREQGWRGVFLDGNPDYSDLGVRTETITALNINYLYHKHGLPEDLDVMSIDVDGQELWIWLALRYRPKVMVVEFNGLIPLGESKVVQFDTNFFWDGSSYTGSSLTALDRIAKVKGYTLVWSNGVNAIFIVDELVSNPDDFNIENLYRPYPYPPHREDEHKRAWVSI